MYQDEQNLYHETYQEGGGEQTRFPETTSAADASAGTYGGEPQRPVQEMKPVKKNRIGL